MKVRYWPPSRAQSELQRGNKWHVWSGLRDWSLITGRGGGG